VLRVRAVLWCFGRTRAGWICESEGVAVDSRGDVWVADWCNSRVEEFNEKGEFVKEFGSKGYGNGQFSGPYALAISPGGLVFVGDVYNNRVEEFTETGELIGTFGSGGSGSGEFNFSDPMGIATDSHGDVWVTDSGNDRVEKWTVSATASTGNPYAHDARTAYYSSGEESTVAGCRKHPEWANLPCQTEPVAQTGVSGSPELPISMLTYNIWDEVEKTEEKFGTGAGAVTRTKTQTYDPAGRALTSEETSSPATDTALPKVTNEYNTETGALEKQSATIAGKTKTLTSKDNTLGQLESYTDAEGETSKYVYGGPGNDGQVEEMSYEIAKEKFSQTYAYSPTTMMLEKLVDSAAGTFTATYDVEGKMLTEGYPNGMTATYNHNSLGQATGIEYVKNTDCATKCPETWFNDTDTPSIHGETLTQTSTLSKENYTYDNIGRLTETQETPAGKHCKSRLYAYDEESNRVSQTTRESGTETCPSEGGATQTHTYDSANRLIDTGMTYETFGNTTKLPEADAEGHTLTSTYYIDNQVASQTQNEETDEYLYDPAGRPMETKSTGKTKATTISHYASSGDALTWICEEEGKKECEAGTETKWSRNIPGIDGTLDAIQSSTGTTVLQLHDLQANIIGTVEDKETETKLLSSYDSTEFGVPNEGKAPPRYAWLGDGGVASETSFGTGTITQGGASYVPQVARNLQTAPVVPPGAFPDGSGTGSQYDSVIPGWSVALGNQESANTIAEYAAKQAELKRQAEEEAAATAQRMHEEEEIPNPNEGGAEEEGYYAQAQALAEEEETNEASTGATIASYKLRLYEGCLDAGFWTYCSGQYHGKWYYNKVASNSPYKKSGVSTGVRVGGAIDGALVAIAGGGAAAGCFIAAGATPEDGQIELVPLEMHCMAIGSGALLAGGALFFDSLGL
jgi:YD repeat-containing protein